MSWTVGDQGKVREVAVSVEAQLSNIAQSAYLQSNPSEMAIFEAARVLLVNAMIGQDPETELEVSANGSQSNYGGEGPTGTKVRITNSVRIVVEAKTLSAA